MPRYHCPIPLHIGNELDLPAGAARHVQVLRHQPGDVITLFEGQTGNGFTGGEFQATITRMGRSDVGVRVDSHSPAEREAARAVHLVVGMPANERMDWLVEKATELGVASIQPVMAARSVLKLKGDRADKKIERWQSIAVSACEQCGRNRIPTVHPLLPLSQRLQQLPQSDVRLLMGLHHPTSLKAIQPAPQRITLMIGPEGGWSPEEEAAAFQTGFQSILLGKRVLRTETAALAAIAAMQTLWGDF